MAKHRKGHKTQTTVGQGARLPCSAVITDYKMGETGNRAEFEDETILQFTPVPSKKRQTGKLERAALFVPNLSTALITNKNFNMCRCVDVN